MIKKGRLLERIDKSLDLEKRLVPLLNRHLWSSLSFSNLKEDDRNTILGQFQDRVVTQIKHIEILNSIRDQINKEKEDVY